MNEGTGRVPDTVPDTCRDRLQRVLHRDRLMLLGLTGGIASGKSVVARMLEELGAVTLDFDVLAREVVRPGSPAWKDIVAFFGDHVLGSDGALDRRTLSRIVFTDEDKRKRLEHFTHPRIFELYAERVEAVAERRPDAVVQAVIPLLIEMNLQHFFHAVAVVYVPAEVQIARLTARDGMTDREAARILHAQLPIHTKLARADWVIRNEGALARTRDQVEEMWRCLAIFRRQQSRSGCSAPRGGRFNT